jgi:hypothetical protein
MELIPVVYSSNFVQQPTSPRKIRTRSVFPSWLKDLTSVQIRKQYSKTICGMDCGELGCFT